MTAAGILMVLVGERLPLPFLDPGSLRDLTRSGSLRELTLLGLGLAPLLIAFLFVEVVAQFAPPLRRLRQGSAADRARLTRAAWALGVLLAALKGWSMTAYLEGIPGTHGYPLLDAGLGPTLGCAATLALGVLVTGGIAALISRFGLGNGFAVLLALNAFEEVSHLGRAMLKAPREQWSEQSLLAGLAVLVIVPIVVARLWRQGTGCEPNVPIPTCGLVVLKGPAEILAFPWRAAAWFPAVTPLAQALDVGDDLYVDVCVALTLPLALLLSRLFCAPRAVVEAYGRAVPGGLDEDGARSVRAAVTRATRRSMLLVMGVALVPPVARAMGVPVWIGVEALLALAVIVAVARDLLAEATARATGAGLVCARPVHRVYAIAPTLQALAAAGISGHSRTLHFRSLFHFFAPYAPIEILVPADRAAEAEGICGKVVQGKQPGAFGEQELGAAP